MAKALKEVDARKKRAHEPKKRLARVPKIAEDEDLHAEGLRLAALNPERMDQHGVIGLQDLVGNRAVTGLLNRSNASFPIQRVTSPAAAAPAPSTVPFPGLPGDVELSREEKEIILAKSVIQNSYGAYIRDLKTGTSTFNPGAVEFFDNHAALLARIDALKMHQHQTAFYGDSPWTAGDAGRSEAGDHMITTGYTDPETKTILLDRTKLNVDPTVVVHEMLHVNAADFISERLGDAINEGLTQYLAVTALSEWGVSVSGSEKVYPEWVNIARSLFTMLGEDLVTQAYFQGAEMLTEAYDARKGAYAFDHLRESLDK